MNNRHDILSDLTAYLDPVHYIDDRGELKTAYLQKDIPGLAINDLRTIDFSDEENEPSQ